jgi:cell division protein FtsW (lipid II flippase)
MMLIDFSTEYSQRSDDELLHLASERHSLTTEAEAALDAEMRRRNLSESDRVEYQKFVKRQERREWRGRRHWKIPIPGLKGQLTGRDILEAFATMAFISFTYIALPSRYHFIKPDWQEAAVIVMSTSVMVVFSAISWRKTAFWMSLGVSSAIQLILLHAVTRRIPNLSSPAGKGAGVLGILLFLVVYRFVRFLQRMLCGKEPPDSA